MDSFQKGLATSWTPNEQFHQNQNNDASEI